MREQKNRILQVVLVLLSIWMIAGISVFAKVEKLNINQMAQEGNNVYIYTDVLDMQGNVISASSLSAKEFAIELDGRSTLEVKDVAIAKKTEGMSYVFCIDISRSVTDSEMQNIKSIMGEFVNNMTKDDYVSIITIGQKITKLCELTNDKSTLTSVVEQVTRSDDYTYLYQGLAQALDTLRMKSDSIPKRAAIILFSDGADDSDRAYGEDDVIDTLKEVRVPVYVVGLGKASNMDLGSVSSIARSSGGALMSYNDYDINEGFDAIKNIIDNAFKVTVVPSEEIFKEGDGKHTWQLRYGDKSNNGTSSNYEFTLSLDDVVFTPKEPEELKEKNVKFENHSTYDGKEKTITIEVKNAAGDVLTEDKDYTFTRNEEIWKEKGEYGFTVAGMGDYSGTLNLTYTIEGIEISDDNIEYESSAEYTAEKQAPSLKVRLNGKTLVEDRDYTVEYGDENWTDAGKYTLTVNGTGSYQGKVELPFEIKKVAITADALDFDSEIVYTGESLAPELTVKLSGKALEESVDYEIDLGEKDWINVGKYNFTVNAKGNYKGTIKQSCSIIPFTLKDSHISFEDSVTYDGTSQKPDTIVVSVDGVTLSENKDYIVDIEHKDWIDAGDYSFTITGQGNYDGSVKEYFKILPAEISADQITYKDTVMFTGANQKPNDVVVKANGVVLSSEDDYVVNIETADWVNAGTYGFEVAGKGNYKGKVELDYTIQKDNLTAESVEYEKIVSYSGSSQKPEEIIVTVADKTLQENTDYTITFNGDEEWIDAGQYSFTIQGTGDYDGEFELPYEIEPAKLSLEHIEYENETVYSGEPLKPQDLQVRVAGRVLEEGKDYTVDFGKDAWVEAGEYTFVVTASGNYDGEVTADYTIYKDTIVKLKNTVIKFAKENTILAIGILVVVLLLLIMIIVLIVYSIKKRKSGKMHTNYDTSGGVTQSFDSKYPTMPIDTTSGIEDMVTLAEDQIGVYRDEVTLSEEGMDEVTIGADDDEETQDSGVGSISLSFEITFEGETRVVDKILHDGERLILGRGDRCDVDVVLGSRGGSSKQTSRQHAYIESRGEGLYVVDQSKNKTYINNRPIYSEETIESGDVLTMGTANVRVMIQL